ncbi:MAG: hypothetical protein JW725_00410 [Candidatus Babeliaceae bacterium]|nr:hypothetical protein [Candidatus Babeliaceae bacterium]
MFSCHEDVVYPGHGVARIQRIVEKSIGGVTTVFYELAFLNKDMVILVPTECAEQVGLRCLSSLDYVRKAFDIISKPRIERRRFGPATGNWNKRNKGYQLKLRTGSLCELSEIYRDLRLVEEHKPLSFGEKHLLMQTEELLAEEISLVKQVDHEAIIEQLRALYSCGKKSVEREG